HRYPRRTPAKPPPVIRSQSASRRLGSFRQVAQDVQAVKGSHLQRLCPLVKIEGASQEDDLKAQTIVIRDVDQTPPRSVGHNRCGKDHLKSTGYCRLTTRRDDAGALRG